jgi:hypothetical protein
MDPKQIERLIVAAERFALAFESLSKIAERLYPEPGETPDAEVYRVGDAKKEPQTKAEYRDFPGDGPGRFQTLIDNAKSQTS